MIFLEKLTCRASLAILLKDELTPDKTLLGDFSAEIPGLRKNQLLASGNYIFMMAPPAKKLSILAEGNYYRKETFLINTQVLAGTIALGNNSSGPKVPLAELWLKPKANYPFPESLTLLRGKIVGSESKPVSGAAVKVKDPQKSSLTEENGSFYFLFDPQDGNKTVTLTIKKDGYKTRTLSLTLNKNAHTAAGAVEIKPS